MSNTDTFQINENYPTSNFLLVPGPNPQYYTVFIFKHSDWITGKQQSIYAIAKSAVNSDGTWKGVFDPISQTYSSILLPETESNGTAVGSYTVVAIRISSSGRGSTPISTVILALQLVPPSTTPYLLPVALGGTATATPSLIAGANVTVTGIWPNQTINSAGGSGGSVSSIFSRTGVVVAVSGDYTVSQVTGAAPLASPTFTGTPAGPTATLGTNTTQLATTAFVIANATGGGGAVSSVFTRTGAVVATSGDYTVAQVTGAAPLASPVLTGTPTAPTPLTADNSTNIATTAYVKAQGYITSSPVTSVFSRTGVVTATSGDYTVSQITGAAPLASPTFTGTPLSVTPSTVDNSTKIATTAYVQAQGYITSAPVSSVFSRTGVVVATSGDYTVSQITGAAPLASPTFTGTPAAPTATVGTNTTQLATTAFVLANAGSGGGMTNPMTTLGDIIYENATPVPARLAGNITSAREFLSQTGTGSPNGYTAGQTVTIDHTKAGSSNSTSFPMLFSGTYAYLAGIGSGGSVTNASGYDIIFTSDSAGLTLLSWEIESYNNTTGAVNFWVQIPTLSSSVNTVIYLWYGKASVTTFQGGVLGAAWVSSFKSVYHLENGTVLSGSDSTTNAVTLTPTNTPTAATGLVDGAATFVSSSSQYITGTASPVTAYPLTLEGWAKLTSTTFATNQERVIAALCNPANTNEWWISYYNLSGTIVIRAVCQNAGGNVQFYCTVPTLDTNWHHIAVVLTSASSFTLYFDGTARTATIVGTSATPTGITTTNIGGMFVSSAFYGGFDGTLDEVRVSNIAMGADWIKSTYNSIFSPSTFYSLTATPAGTSAVPAWIPLAPSDIPGGLSGGVSSKTANYLAVTGDAGKLISFNSTSSLTLTLPATPPSSTWFIDVEDVGPGGLTISPNGLLLDGSSASLIMSGAAPVNDSYILGVADAANLPNSVVNPKAYYGVDVAPAVAGSLDDEFNGSTLNTTSRWTWINQSTATALVSNSLLSMRALALAGDNMRVIVQPIPAGVTYEVTAKVSPFSTAPQNFQFSGIVITDGLTTSNKITTLGFGMSSGSQALMTIRWSTFTGSGGGTFSAVFPWSMTTPWYLRIRDNTGGNLVYSYSKDGITWIQVLSEARTTFLTPAYIGLGMESNNSAADIYLTCDWFRRTL